jgi:hypothetical protein
LAGGDAVDAGGPEVGELGELVGGVEQDGPAGAEQGVQAGGAEIQVGGGESDEGIGARHGIADCHAGHEVG